MKYQFLRFPEGKAKAVTLSYDDGCLQDLRFAELITGYGLKCTFNLCSDVCRSTPLTKEQVETYFLSAGHEIAVHGALHRAEGNLRPIEGIRDILDCRLELEERYGRIIRGMAYPDFGIRRMSCHTSYEAVKQYAKELDIVYCRTLGKDNNEFYLPEDWHCWMPTAHHNNPKLMDWIREFVEMDPSTIPYRANRAPRLFYLWGHSFEFDRDNNWELVDAIGQNLGGREDIWYATNMEIYEYVTAYHSMIYSADGRRIYNPTLHTVWFDVDGKLYTSHPGETLVID